MAKLPFEEQINYHRARLNLPTQSYADIYGEEHDHAFVVAGANRLDILADFREVVDKAIIDGTTLEEFREDFDAIVAKYGWEYNGGRNWRSRTIYDTNLYASYQAGRYEQQREMAKLKPYWEYRHRAGQRDPREEHEAWDGLILHCDDPWWQTHYPINDYNCKCSVFAHSQRDLERKGLSVGTAPPIEYETLVVGKNSPNPRVVEVPKGIGAGFDRIPGASRKLEPTQYLFNKASAVPPQMASRVMANTLQIPEIRKLLNQEVAAMVDSVDIGRQKLRINKAIGVIAPDVIAELEKIGYAPQTAVITLRDEDILHAIRTIKGKQLSVEFWRNIAEHIQTPEAIFLDTSQETKALIYVFGLDTGGDKVIMKLNYTAKVRNTHTGKRVKTTINILRSGAEIGEGALKETLAAHRLIYGKKPW